jgi:uncharacterized protein
MRVDVVESLSSIPAHSWDALAHADEYPFVSHAFLQSLLDARCIGPRTPWLPRYVIAHDGDDRLIAAAPSYRRLDSMGEFVFDFRLAEVAARFGVNYYPKWTIAAPFTPATSPRLWCAPSLRSWWVEQLLSQAKRDGASGVHLLFCTHEERSMLAPHMAPRSGVQFHWRNDGYSDFDDFLQRLKHDERKQLKRDRRRVVDSGLRIQTRCAGELSPQELLHMHALYESTSARKWGRPYLNQAWFAQLSRVLPTQVVFCTAHDGDEALAMAMSFEGRHALYGRYWGTSVDVPGLHFELCYHQLVERAITRGHRLVEAGAQGEHKLKRGFVPVVTHSAHQLFHPAFHEAVAVAFASEAQHIEDDVAGAAAHTPFKEGTAPAVAAVAGPAWSSG